MTGVKIDPWMHRLLCVGGILCLISAIAVGSVFIASEYQTMEPTDEQRLRSVTQMDQSNFFVQEPVVATMLAFDSSTEEGICNFRGFIKKVVQGGTGRSGRNFASTQLSSFVRFPMRMILQRARLQPWRTCLAPCTTAWP